VTASLNLAHTVTKLPVQDLDRARAFYRDRLGLESFEMPDLETQDGIVVIPDNYPSKGTGERGAFLRDSEGNLLAIAQATR
jgi:predicted enzyme related to lactoylglutathione lyase